MNRIGDIIDILSLGTLAFQDFRSREISWWLLPIVVAGLLLGTAGQVSFAEIGHSFLVNMLFLGVQFALLWAWFFLRNRKRTKLIDRQIGLGDILFVICPALAFSPVNFLVYYTVSLVLTLTGVLLFRMFRSPEKLLIPLAGALSLSLIVLCCWRLADPRVNFYSDEWLLSFAESC